MESTLHVSIGEINEVNQQVILFDGEFDKAGYSDVKEDLDRAVKNFTGKTLVFDFEKLKFINSEGIGYLMEVHAHLVKGDKRLVVVSANDHIEDVFQAIGIHEVIPVFADLKSIK